MKTSFKSLTEYEGHMLCSLQRKIMVYIWKHKFQGKQKFNIQLETCESLSGWQVLLSTTEHLMFSFSSVRQNMFWIKH